MGKVLAQGLDIASSVANHSLNEPYVDDKTGNEYVYIKASGALDANDAVIIDENGTAVVVNVTNTDGAFGDRVGVVNVAVPDGYYAWAQVKGTTSVNVLANASANTSLNSTGTDGTLDDDGAVGAEVIDGIVLTTANGGATSATACILHNPTVGATL